MSERQFPRYIKPRIQTRIESEYVGSQRKHIGQQSNPVIYATSVAYRTGFAKHRADRLRLKLLQLIPAHFAINVSDMNDADEVIQSLQSVGIDKTVLQLKDIIYIYNEYRKTISTTADLNSFPRISQMVDAINSNQEILPSLSVWEYLIASIREYLWYPNSMANNTDYNSVVSLISYYMLASDISSELTGNINSIVDIYELFDDEEVRFNIGIAGDPTDIQAIASGDNATIDAAIIHGNNNERAIGDHLAPKREDIEEFPFQEQIDMLEQALNCHGSQIREDIRQLIDPSDLQGLRDDDLDEQIANRIDELQTNLSMRVDFNRSIGEIDSSTRNHDNMTTGIYNTLGQTVDGILGAGPECIVQVAVDKWEQSGAVEDLTKIKNRLEKMLGILRAGQALQMSDTINMASIWNSLNSIGQSIIRRVITRSLQSIVTRMRSNLSNAVGGLRVDSDIVRCMGLGRLANEVVNIGEKLLIKYQGELDSLLDFNDAKGAHGLSMIGSLNTSHVSSRSIKFLQDTIGTLNSIININRQGASSSSSSTVDSVIANMDKSHHIPTLEENTAIDLDSVEGTRSKVGANDIPVDVTDSSKFDNKAMHNTIDAPRNRPAQSVTSDRARRLIKRLTS